MNPENRGKAAEQSTGARPATTMAGVFQPNHPTAMLVNEETIPKIVRATKRYEIVSELGRGGSGIVYLAVDKDLNRNVAVKILRSEFLDRPKLVWRFIEESKIMGSLQHPCITNVYDCGTTDDGRPFYAMALVQGQTMHSMLHDVSGNRFLTARMLGVYSRVCQAMAYTHAHDIVHLDLKPANVMVGGFGEVHLMDWGLARHRTTETRTLLPGTEKKFHVQGTLEYMSPEQAHGDALDQRTDVFCLGAMLFEILTGTTIYHDEDRATLHRQAKNAELDAALEKLDNCHAKPALIRLVKLCLAPDPQDRPLNATVLSAEMSAYQASTLETIEDDMARFFELSLDLFCIAGFDGYFRRINTNFSRTLGYSESELLSQPFLNFIHEDDRPQTTDEMVALMDGQPVAGFRNRFVTKAGRLIELEWTAKSIPEENTIFAVARRISEED